MDADFGIISDYSAKLTVPQSDDFVVTAPEVALQPVTQGSLGGFAASITPLQSASFAP